MTTPATWSAAISGSSTHEGTMSRICSPRSAGEPRPAAISAAIGAKISRPWNVALTTGRPKRFVARATSTR
jgi:hypothetical protein